MSIPQIVVHVWPGKDPFRPKFHGWRVSWMQRHPDFTFLFFRLGQFGTNYPVSDPRVARILSNPSLSVVVKSDVLRLHALNLYGGIYADTDVECLKPFHELLNDPNECFFAKEPQRFDFGAASPALIAAAPHHPFVEAYLDKAISNIETMTVYDCNRRTHLVTGPRVMDEVVKGRTDVTVHPTTYFYPENPAEDAAAYAKHYWNGTADQALGWTARVNLGQNTES